MTAAYVVAFMWEGEKITSAPFPTLAEARAAAEQMRSGPRPWACWVENVRVFEI